MYDGQWLESQFDGEGRHTNRFGDQFAGELVHNCYHGSGVMRYKDGSIYDGIWEKGHRHGFGSFRDPKGVEYNGNWRLDQRHGQGYQKYADGSVYDGECFLLCALIVLFALEHYNTASVSVLTRVEPYLK